MLYCKPDFEDIENDNIRPIHTNKGSTLNGKQFTKGGKHFGRVAFPDYA